MFTQLSLLVGIIIALPSRISSEAIQAWLLWLLKERDASPSTCRQYFNGVRFLYALVLEDEAFAEYRITLPKRQQRLPDLLSASYPRYHRSNTRCIIRYSVAVPKHWAVSNYTVMIVVKNNAFTTLAVTDTVPAVSKAALARNGLNVNWVMWLMHHTFI